MNDPLTCKHDGRGVNQFRANVNVNVTTDKLDADGNPLRLAEITIVCAECLRPFYGAGLEPGYRPDFPTVTINRGVTMLPLLPMPMEQLKN